ncbi:IclR family transcriptional regulator [Noviherbaspirillum soli]|uniref:IclR family transcriptional regulator n=1 Tax=Noviherbaspirillum soli TaxID=1064518 RepID=UPI001E5EF395|nr:IclR family transcriptional regulator [Noviherbaspirillum soli]
MTQQLMTSPDAILSRPNIKEDRHFVTALARGLELLACFRSGDKLLGNQELAERSKLPKSTVSRLTYTLTKLGYLQYDEQVGKYRLGTATLALGSAMLSRLDIRQMARPLMQELADFSHTMVSLGMRDRLSMIYVENCRSQAALTLRLDVGARIPVASTAMGRAYLAEVSANERNDILERVRDLDELAWPALRDRVMRSVDEYHTLGCCTSFGDWQPDVNAIAVAFRPTENAAPLSINCGGPAFNLSREFLLEEVRPRLIELVAQLRRPSVAHYG